MSIFDKRIAFKPFEYPEIADFKTAINHSYWLVSEWNFVSDIQDFKIKLNEKERNAIKNTLLGISQIEVSVKKFWGKIGDFLPKAEFEQVGACYAESEVRHGDAYSHLLQVLDLNDDFASLLEVPAIKGRVTYLTKYLNEPSDSKEKFTMKLALFSLFIENVSLFSQFAIIKSFNRYLGVLKDIDNVVDATAQEERLHALLGVKVINYIKEEYPNWFNVDFYNKLYKASEKAFKAESAIIDWIFEQGELEFLSKESLKEFIKDRMNQSLQMIGGEKIFEINDSIIEGMDWFSEEIDGSTNIDFFHKKSTNYSKRTQSFSEVEMF